MELKLVPQSDIDAIEIARRELFKIIPEVSHHRLAFGITDKMYHLTHKKYEAFSQSPKPKTEANCENCNLCKRLLPCPFDKGSDCCIYVFKNFPS